MPNVSNEDFLQVCFGPEWEDAHVCWFREDPSDLESLGLKHFWTGGKWGRMAGGGRGSLPVENAYFTISTFNDDPDTGRALRRKALFRATHVIVLDDVGTKVDPAAAAKLPSPSWALETSPGNYQWGYILDVPETDAGRVNALLDGLVANGLVGDGKDPGMKGVTRYVRLPEGRNTKAKYGPGGFACRLSVWLPGRRFAMEDLARPFGIDLPAPGASGTGVAGRPKIDAKGDELFGWLETWGMVTGARAADGEGWEIECPWVGEHTGRASTGTAYWLGGAFKCHHGHCEMKGRRDLACWADERVQEESGGLTRLSAFGFDVVPGYRPGRPHAGGARPGEKIAADHCGGVGGVTIDFGTGVGGEFFGEFIYVGAEDRFFSTRTGDLLSRQGLDGMWAARLAGELPVVSARSGEKMPPSRWFLDEMNAARARLADAVTYWPGEARFFATTDGVAMANRWAPPERLGLDVADADVEPWLRLVRHVTSRDGAAATEWLLDWMALVVAAPGIKPGWHVIVQGGQGVGKDMIALPMRTGVGDPANLGEVDATGLHSAFNEYAEKRLVIADELKQSSRGSATGADQYGVLKALTQNTSPVVKVNQKNMRPYFARNVCAFYCTTNDDAAVALEADDRRFMVIMAGTAADTAPWPKPDYLALAEWLIRRGGNEICAEWLWDRWAAMDAGRRAVLLGPAPRTAGRALMVKNVEDPWTGRIREAIEDAEWPDLMTGSEITEALARISKTGGGGLRFPPSAIRWGSIVRALGGGKVYGGNQVRLKSGVRVRLWATRGIDRFVGMSEAILSQAYKSAAAHAFADDDESVIAFTTKKETASDASDKEGGK